MIHAARFFSAVQIQSIGGFDAVRRFVLDAFRFFSAPIQAIGRFLDAFRLFPELIQEIGHFLLFVLLVSV